MTDNRHRNLAEQWTSGIAANPIGAAPRIVPDPMAIDRLHQFCILVFFLFRLGLAECVLQSVGSR